MGTKSSENVENNIFDILNLFNLGKDRFTDLQMAVNYIEIVDTNDSAEVKNLPTLGQILSLELK